MSDLVDFLRARLDEDEEVARATLKNEQRVDGTDRWFASHSNAIMSMAPHRAVAEVEAKRRILRAHAKWCQGECEAKYPNGGFDAAHYWSIKSLAAVYADHRDYREEWRP